MKRKLLLIGLLIWNLNSIFGQSFCSTAATSNNLSLNTNFQMKSKNKNSYCLKVYFHVIRRSNGTGGQLVSSANEAFDILNQDFNTHNISFSWDNQIDYIDNDNFYSTPSSAIFNVNNHSDGIDIYLFDDSSNAGGRANGVGNSSEFYVSGSFWKAPNNPLTRSHVISHEMGHVLFLWHTHHGTYNEGGNDNPCPELVNGSNSSTCGDYVNDTPADPHLQFDVNQSTCEWNSSGTDENGDQYNPDEKNVMSYTDINCMEYFSQGQGERMRNAISTLPYLQQTIASNCSVSAEITGDNLICYGGNKTYNFTNIGINFTWQVSSNLQIVSSNSTSITVTPTSSTIRETGFIKAILPNQTFEKNIWIGKPDAYTVDSNGIRNYMGGSFYFQPQSGAIGEFSVFSDYLGGTWNWTGPNNVSWWQINRNTIEIDISFSGSYIFTAEFTNECGTHYYFVFVDIGGFQPDFIISPNPASEDFTISSSKNNLSTESLINYSYELIDINSNILLKNKFKKNDKVNVSHLKNGLYILKIISDKKVEHYHVIKK